MSHRKLFAAVGAVVFLLSSVAVVEISSAASGTVEFDQPVSAATYVSWNSSSTNFDGSTLISASHISYRALLQFATGIPDGSTVDSATLTIDAANAGGGVFSVYNVGQFDPTTVTWNTRPALAGGPLGTTGSPTGTGTQTIPLTGLNVGDVTNLALTYSQPGMIARLFGAPDNPPILDVVYSPPGSTTTTGPADTTTTTGAGSSTTEPPSTTTTTTAPPTSTTMPPTTTTQPSTGTGHKVLVIMEENHSESEALSQMPTLAGYAAQYGQATNYFAISHPSLPNYVAIWSGDTQGISSDCGVGPGCQPSGPTVWGQTIAAGETAKAYQESMTSNCQTSGGGAYVARHGPWPYFTDATEQADCAANDVPLGTTTGGNLLTDVQSGNLPVTGEITPNLDNDAHDGTLAQADSWLQGWLPIIMAGPDYQSGDLTIVVTFDEDDSSQGNNVPLVVIDPRLSNVQVTGTFNHYSLTRWLEDNAGVSLLRNAASAPDLRAAFGL